MSSGRRTPTRGSGRRKAAVSAFDAAAARDYLDALVREAETFAASDEFASWRAVRREGAAPCHTHHDTHHPRNGDTPRIGRVSYGRTGYRRTVARV